MNTTEDICRSYADSLAGCTAAEAEALTKEFQYVSALMRHDWNYQWADDYNVWLVGLASKERLIRQQRAIDPDFALWNRYCPEDHKVTLERLATDKSEAA